jgi:integrase
MGLLVLVLFESYLRPSEALAMAPCQLIEPEQNAAGVRRWLCLVVHPEESDLPNKVNEYDHSVPLDLERQQFLVPALVALKHRRAGQNRLWPFRYVELSRAFNQAVLTLGLVSTGISLYGLRHGGASHDRSMRSRDLKEVQQRGGWRSFTSVRRYEKHGRLGLEWAKLPAGVKSQALIAPDLVLRLFGQNYARSSSVQVARSSTLRSLPAAGTSVKRFVPMAKRSSRLTSKKGRTTI